MRYWIGRTGGGIGGRNQKHGSLLPSCRPRSTPRWLPRDRPVRAPNAAVREIE